jgi:hypothetical protein
MQGIGSDAMCHNRTRAPQHEYNYSITTSARASSIGGTSGRQKKRSATAQENCETNGWQSRSQLDQATLKFSNLALALTRSEVSKPSLKDP